jgi:gelsolin
MPSRVATAEAIEGGQNALFRLSDSTGQVTFEPVQGFSRSSLASEDAFLLDATSYPNPPTIYVWIGGNASLNERRLVLQYAQRYLHTKRRGDERVKVAVGIVKMREGHESEDFLEAMGS